MWNIYRSVLFGSFGSRMGHEIQCGRLIDIHAAKGSQNGKGHSSPPDSEKLYWSPYPENIDNTIEVAHFLAAHYRYTPSFLGVELLNEPTSVDGAKLKDYYIRAYDAIRKTIRETIASWSPLLFCGNRTPELAKIGRISCPHLLTRTSGMTGITPSSGDTRTKRLTGLWPRAWPLSQQTSPNELGHHSSLANGV